MRAACIAIICLFVTSAASQPSADAETERAKTAMNRLGVTLEKGALDSFAVRKALDALGREPCDQQAIIDLGDALEKVSYRREAARFHIGFSSACSGHAPSLRRAVNILLGLSDHEEVVRVSSDLIRLEPFNDNGYYLRAVGYDRMKEARKAIDDYTTAIELFGVKERIASVGYLGLARNYERLGRHCDAVGAIDAWVAINPGRNDTSQTRSIIAGYSGPGKCLTAPLAKEPAVNLPITRRGQVVLVDVKINGVQGRFILDTGATFVSLKRSFATKAKVDIEEDSEVRLNTANGVALASRGEAKTVELRSLKESNVAVVVQKDAAGTYGEGIDGLLGMSFLSRFTLILGANTVRIERRRPR
jgi:clan AA aspartic protease (TIGR02281 family)